MLKEERMEMEKQDGVMKETQKTKDEKIQN